MNRTSRLIARAINEIKPAQGDEVFLKGTRHGVELLAHALADALGSEYPAFDRAKFLRFCGVPTRKPEKTRP